ncbi:MAG: YsnF/AvaK domain-containing protein [Anaerobacillus sp.]|uniref:YsnF/AvaK domain-containing protein n=1 Tax=Anaerobacillus sp. TaxID=1872506 RepID=UPI00391BC900
MGFFDFLNEEPNQKEIPKKVRGDIDTEFAEENAHLDLRQEELDIHKNRVETGEVVLHKDIVEEEQIVNVPVSHDQVVIERKVIDREPTTEPITDEETVHIPVTAETIDVDKHTVVTGEISAHKRSVQETEQVRDVLHKEVADVETHGNADIIKED